MKFYCDKCDDRFHYSEIWDSYYCKRCNEWTSSVCGDPKCWFQCHKRPKRPIPEETPESQEEGSSKD